MDVEILEKLKKLQGVLYSIYQMDKEINELPSALSTMSDLVQRLKKNFVEVSEKARNKSENIQKTSERLRQAEADRYAFEQEMSDLPIDATRDSESLDKKIKDACNEEKKQRDRLKKEKTEFDELKAKMDSQEALISMNEADYQSLQEKINSEMDDKKSQLAELIKIKEELIPGMDADLLFKFDRIIRNKEGQGIVPIKDRVCSGCHMLLPAQFANDIQSGQEIHFCPYCSRILFYEAGENIQEDFSFSDSDAGGLVGAFEEFNNEY